MSDTVDRPFHLVNAPRRAGGMQVKLVRGEEPPGLPADPEPEPESDVPHSLARQMAMAITCKQLIESGAVKDAAELARVAGVTRARMTQVLDLTLLAPVIQEKLLFLMKGEKVDRRKVKEAAREMVWERQKGTLLNT